MTRRGRRPAGVLRLGAFCAAVAATVALTQAPVSGAFSAVRANTGNSAASAASFCTMTPTTLLSTGDSWVDEANPTANHQNDLEMKLRSLTGGNYRIWIGFGLPGLPAASTHCQLAQATLSLTNKAPFAGRNIDVYRGDPTDPAWTAATVTWANDPDYVGSAATNAQTTNVAGRQAWDVTAHVVRQYADGNNGFLLKDRSEGSGVGAEQVYYDRQDVTHRPTLVLTWG